MKTTDANDLARTFGLDGLRTAFDEAPDEACNAASTTARLLASPARLSLSVPEFLATPLPPRELILPPWLPAGGLAMVHAWRGVGKTLFAIGVAHAVASGGSYLGWQAPKPAKVLFVDGEMPATMMQSRLKAAVGMGSALPTPDHFRLITPDMLPDGMIVPNLMTADGRAALKPELDGCDLAIFDNVATLFPNPDDQNAAGGWLEVQNYILNLRRRRIAVLLVDHDGKGGANRGTSAKHDVLDTVIHLTKPSDYIESQGARFLVNFEKHRGFWGRETLPFEAQLLETAEGQTWTTASTEAADARRVADMMRDGATESAMRKQLGCGGSRITRLKELATAFKDD